MIFEEIQFKLSLIKELDDIVSVGAIRIFSLIKGNFEYVNSIFPDI